MNSTSKMLNNFFNKEVGSYLSGRRARWYQDFECFGRENVDELCQDLARSGFQKLAYWGDVEQTYLETRYEGPLGVDQGEEMLATICQIADRHRVAVFMACLISPEEDDSEYAQTY